MTTTTLSPRGAIVAPTASQRIINVAKLHLVNRSTLLWIPWSIMTVIFLGNLLVWWMVTSIVAQSGGGADGDPKFYGGASLYVVIYMLVVAVQAINLTFPFAQGYSVTRRDFYLGSALVFVSLSVLYSLAITVLGEVERVTKGWGLGGQMFYFDFLGGAGFAGLATRFYVTLVAFLFFFFLGASVAAMWVRWRMWGLLGFFTGLGALLIGLLALFTFTGTWPVVGAWFAANGTIGVATWTLLPTAIAAVTGYLFLRKATPHN